MRRKGGKSMSYLYIFLATIMFSLVGTLVKIASLMVPATAVTFSRFFFGCIVLLIVCLFAKHKPKLFYKSKWIWIAVAGKCLNYFTENYALHQGLSYGNIISFPVQAIALCFFSALVFKEKIGPRKILATILCVAGVLLISWNGHDMHIFVGDSLPILILFIFSGTGAAAFILCQKMLIKEIRATDMNLSVFIMGALIASVPMGVQANEFLAFRWESLLALIGLGVVTGGAFLLVSKSLEKLSLVVAGMIQNSSSLFTLLWAVLFFNESVTVYVIVGTVVFLIGLVFINFAPKKGIFVN